MASLKDILIKVGVDNRALDRGLRSMERSLRQSGRRAAAIGRNIHTNLTLPLAAIGTVGIKNYMELEESLTKINTLVGISAEEVNKSAKAIRSMSVEVGKTQNELADALFFIQSAGIRDSAEAMQVLERTSKASAIGLGETKDVADAVTSVMLAYGDGAYTAAQATDILTKAVEQGKMEATAFSPAIGRVLGIAAQLGVSFEEVSANVAMYTRAGVSAEEATTGLRGVLNTILGATPEMKKRLESLGIPIEKVRESLGRDGLVATLHMLMEAFDGNLDAMGDVFANVRALANVTFTSGKAFEDYQVILDEVNNSMGKVDEGFETTRKQTFFRFKQAVVQLQNASIDLAGMLLPIFSKILTAVTGLIDKFSSLDPEIKKQIGQWGLYVIAVGGAATVLGKVLPLLGSLVGAFRKLIKMKFTPLHIALAAIAGIAVYVYKNWDTVKTAIVNVVNYFIKLYNESIEFRAVAETIVMIFKSLLTIGKYIYDTFAGIFSRVGEIVTSILQGKFKEIPKILSDGFSGQIDLWVGMGEEIGTHMTNGLYNVIKPKELLEITESDVQAFADKMGQPLEYVKKLLKEIKQLTEVGEGGGPSVPEEKSPNRPNLEPVEKLAKLKPEVEKLDYTVTKTWTKLLTMLQAGGFGGGQFPLLGIFQTLNKAMEENAKKWDAIAGKLSRISEMTGALGELTSTLMDRQIASIEAKSDKEREAIEQSGFDEETKAKKIEKIEEVKSRRIAHVKTQQAVAEKAFNIAQSVMNTGVAVTEYLASGVGTALVPWIIAMGAIQTATIAAQPIPKFAKGGIVSGPMLGMFGEYPGANAGNPEVVAPLKDLKSLLGNMGGATQIHLSAGFELVGQNLRAAVTRSTVNHGRIYGFS